mgnify:CR=1 FL=1
MNSRDLQHYIDEHHIQATILPMDEHTPTVSDAARALGVETDQIIKSLVFQVDSQPVLVVTNGLARVDRKKLAQYLGVGRKRVKFASPEQALEITGYIVGSMPPFGHNRKLRTLVDASTVNLDVVFGGGGSIDAMMRLTSNELLGVTDGEVVVLSESAE